MNIVLCLWGLVGCVLFFWPDSLVLSRVIDPYGISTQQYKLLSIIQLKHLLDLNSKNQLPNS